ncbi:GH16383 [Drosophila grimshawi]|uniref:GH16383 n=1 Tax=Drosophila grimshawi TaxID=7222 RepID=B4IZA9_DROGR|nr:GH16383 [Drosophila grimshawi]
MQLEASSSETTSSSVVTEPDSSTESSSSERSSSGASSSSSVTEPSTESSTEISSSSSEESSSQASSSSSVTEPSTESSTEISSSSTEESASEASSSSSVTEPSTESSTEISRSSSEEPSSEASSSSSVTDPSTESSTEISNSSSEESSSEASSSSSVTEPSTESSSEISHSSSEGSSSEASSSSSVTEPSTDSSTGISSSSSEGSSSEASSSSSVTEPSTESSTEISNSSSEGSSSEASSSSSVTEPSTDSSTGISSSSSEGSSSEASSSSSVTEPSTESSTEISSSSTEESASEASSSSSVTDPSTESSTEISSSSSEESSSEASSSSSVTEPSTESSTEISSSSTEESASEASSSSSVTEPSTESSTEISSSSSEESPPEASSSSSVTEPLTDSSTEISSSSSEESPPVASSSSSVTEPSTESSTEISNSSSEGSSFEASSSSSVTELSTESSTEISSSSSEESPPETSSSSSVTEPSTESSTEISSSSTEESASEASSSSSVTEPSTESSTEISSSSSEESPPEASSSSSVTEPSTESSTEISSSSTEESSSEASSSSSVTEPSTESSTEISSSSSEESSSEASSSSSVTEPLTDSSTGISSSSSEESPPVASSSSSVTEPSTESSTEISSSSSEESPSEASSCSSVTEPSTESSTEISSSSSEESSSESSNEFNTVDRVENTNFGNVLDSSLKLELSPENPSAAVNENIEDIKKSATLNANSSTKFTTKSSSALSDQINTKPQILPIPKSQQANSIIADNLKFKAPGITSTKIIMSKDKTISSQAALSNKKDMDIGEPYAVPSDGGVSSKCKLLPNGVFLRDSKLCGKFYVCASGRAIPHYCPGNLYFDIKKLVCNFPSLVDCTNHDKAHSSVPKKTSSPLPEKEMNTVDRVEKSNFGSVLESSLKLKLSPERPSAALTEKIEGIKKSATPNANSSPKVSTKFSSALSDQINTIPQILSIPKSQQANLIIADNMKSKAPGISSTKIVISKDKATSAQATLSNEKDMNIGEPYAVPSDGDVSSKCKLLPNGVFLRDFKLCGKFYVCANGRAIPHYCPGVLYFDVKKLVCNFPSLVDCTNDNKAHRSVPKNSLSPLPEKQINTVDRVEKSNFGSVLESSLKLKPSPEGASAAAKEENKEIKKSTSATSNANSNPKVTTKSPSASSDQPQILSQQANSIIVDNLKSKAPGITSTKMVISKDKPTSAQATLSNEKDMDIGEPYVVPSDGDESSKCKLLPNGVFLRDSKLCGKFYVCENGSATPHDCPGDLYFDIKKLICNIPSLVDCTNNNKAHSSVPKNSSSLLPEKQINTVDRVEKSNFGSVLESALKLKPSPESASAAAKQENKEIKKSTSATSNANSNPKVTTKSPSALSDQPQILSQQANSIIVDNSKSKAPGITSTKMVISKDKPTSAQATLSNEKDMGIGKPYAVPSDGEVSSKCKLLPNGVFLRDSKLCGKFYVCASGRAIPHYCPVDLYFDIKKQVCNFPSLVDCTNNNKAHSSVPKNSSSLLPEKQINTVDRVEKSNFGSVLESALKLKPSPESASAAAKQENKEIKKSTSATSNANSNPKVTTKSPSALSDQPQILSQQANSIIVDNSKSKALGITSTKMVISKDKPTSAQATLSNEKDMGIGKPYAVPSDGEVSSKCKLLPNGVFLRDSKLCGKFYVCASGRAIPHYCPVDLYFDIKKQVCNFPSLVNCSDARNASSPSSKTVWNVKKVALRQRKLCNKYYVCMNGSPTAHFCTPGKWFDLNRQVCEPKHLVDCRN